jgi:hypothetical protein
LLAYGPTDGGTKAGQEVEKAMDEARDALLLAKYGEDVPDIFAEDESVATRKKRQPARKRTARAFDLADPCACGLLDRVWRGDTGAFGVLADRLEYTGHAAARPGRTLKKTWRSRGERSEQHGHRARTSCPRGTGPAS